MPIPKAPEREVRTLVRDEAYAQIKRAILSGVIQPGERLDDKELQQWLGVSRTPVRQALYALSLEGLVESAPQAYTRVVAPDPHEAVQYLQVTGVLVIGHMELTLPTAAKADVERLVSELRVIHRALVARDIAAAVAASEIYHLDLIGLCPNLPLRRLTEQAGTSLAYYVTAVYRSLDADWDAVIADYEALIAAYEDGRIDDACAAVRRLFTITPGNRITVMPEA